MRESTLVAEPQVSSETKCAVPPRSLSVATPALSLPAIADGAFFRCIEEGGDRKIAALGLMLARQGLLRRDDVQGDLCQAVTRALGKWLDLSWGGMRWFGFSCQLHDTVVSACGEAFADTMQSWEPARVEQMFATSTGVSPFVRHVCLRLASGRQRNLLVGDGVEDLENLAPGLGWTVLHAITETGAKYDLFGLEWSEYAAESIFWGGCESEIVWAEECGEPLDDYEGMTRAKFEELIPVTKMRAAKRLNRRQLRSLASAGDDRAARIAGTLLGLQRLKSVEAAFETDDLSAELDLYDCMEPGVMLGWKDMGAVHEVVDTFGNDLMNGGAELRDFLGLVGVSLEDESSLRRLEMKWKLPARKLRLVDTLLSEIAHAVR